MSTLLQKYENGQLVYPNPIQNGLVLWYDMAGKRNTDADKDTIEDFSGNNNNGTLQNFNFTTQSGYHQNKLIFDGVDDAIQIPNLGLNTDSMTIGLNNRYFSYDNGMVTTVDENNNTFTEHTNDITESRNGILLIPNSTTDYPMDLVETPEYTILYSLEGAIGISTFTVELIDYPTGTDYIHSVEIWSPIEVLARIGSQGTNVTIQPETWTRIWYQGVSTGDSVRVGGIYTDRPVDGLRYRKYMSFEGTTPTEWSPHPDDYTSQSISYAELRDLKYYNRPLTAQEIQTNQQIMSGEV